MVLASLASPKLPVHGLQMAAFLLYFHMAEREIERSSLCLYTRALILLMQIPPPKGLTSEYYHIGD